MGQSAGVPTDTAIACEVLLAAVARVLVAVSESGIAGDATRSIAADWSCIRGSRASRSASSAVRSVCVQDSLAPVLQKAVAITKSAVAGSNAADPFGALRRGVRGRTDLPAGAAILSVRRQRTFATVVDEAVAIGPAIDTSSDTADSNLTSCPRIVGCTDAPTGSAIVQVLVNIRLAAVLSNAIAVDKSLIARPNDAASSAAGHHRSGKTAALVPATTAATCIFEDVRLTAIVMIAIAVGPALLACPSRASSVDAPFLVLASIAASSAIVRVVVDVRFAASRYVTVAVAGTALAVHLTLFIATEDTTVGGLRTYNRAAPAVVLGRNRRLAAITWITIAVRKVRVAVLQ